MAALGLVLSRSTLEEMWRPRVEVGEGAAWGEAHERVLNTDEDPGPERRLDARELVNEVRTTLVAEVFPLFH